MSIITLKKKISVFNIEKFVLELKLKYPDILDPEYCIAALFEDVLLDFGHIVVSRYLYGREPDIDKYGDREEVYNILHKCVRLLYPKEPRTAVIEITNKILVIEETYA